MKRILLLVTGHIFLGLGIVGLFFPVLPTTPFLLLAAACFLRSSIKLYNRLMNHKVFGRHLEGYFKYKAVSLKAKVISISMLWIGISASMIFFVDDLWIRILLSVIAAGVTVYLLRLKTLSSCSQEII